MHELSIAMEIVEIAEKEMTKVAARQVDLIELEIGVLAGVEFESLNFVWPSAVKGTALQNAKKSILKVEGKAKCNDCNAVFEITDIYDDCPKCKSYQKEVITGKELLVKRLEVS